MTKRASSQAAEPKRSSLLVPRTEAEEKIRTQIAKGQDLLQRPLQTEDKYELARQEYQKWLDYTWHLLNRIVDTNELAADFAMGSIGTSIRTPTLDVKVRELQTELRHKLTKLESILERLELIPETVSPEIRETKLTGRIPTDGPVFVVHGHDNEAKQSVARCIEQLGLQTVILHEQPNKGRTIIEKLEGHSDVSFAVVLLTPDDVGASRDDQTSLFARARQNVVFELGLFIGKLGRERVCALHKGDIELPSDLDGILWIAMDTAGSWRYSLAKEMKDAGLNADLNRL